ncbi:putative sensory transducer protein YfmS [bioreactor metagenome]|uniref:Methyl-accepting chemotaxis protein signaling domain protein n=2 Tax=root TaxID=1 RepID=A0A098AWR2_DESHA|nr:methyl-accepting chemotaxis protein [Desulfitobacterium hafniense]MEA5024145.1 methyl-accepting chemotaxis protein [Desulfitobacterium hafniense]CDX00567.1 Methyl-accepting chemotaxis protein signaling domain protein [Desulfitobacterium hafniense]
MMNLAVQSDEELLAGYAAILSRLKELIKEDLMVLITDKTHILYFYPGYKLNASNMQLVGLELPADDDLGRCVRTGESNTELRPKEAFGVPFLAMTAPIHNSRGEIIGCVSIGRSMEKEANLEEASQSLAASLQEVNAGLQEIASGSQILSSKINSVVQSANDSAVKIKEVNQVIRAIADVSAHSNLLGLNAAIEAARAGEQGKGFAVVAEEMRTLARQSKDSAKMVTEILTQMKDSIESIIWEVDQIGGIAGNQAASTQEITAVLEEISENSQTLVEHAKIKIENR